MRTLVVLLLVIAAPAWAQDRARPLEGLSDEQRAEYRKLLRSYIDTFRIAGRSRIGRLDFDAGPLFREVERRHGGESELLAVARLAYASGAENLLLDEKLYPSAPPPMPCDVMVHMQGMGLPPLPASLVQK